MGKSPTRMSDAGGLAGPDDALDTITRGLSLLKLVKSQLRSTTVQLCAVLIYLERQSTLLQGNGKTQNNVEESAPGTNVANLEHPTASELCRNADAVVAGHMRAMRALVTGLRKDSEKNGPLDGGMAMEAQALLATAIEHLCDQTRLLVKQTGSVHEPQAGTFF